MKFPIEEHSFNTNWFGARFGVSTDINLLHADREEVRLACSEFSVVELRVPTLETWQNWVYPNESFKEVDQQIHYRITTKKFSTPSSNSEFVDSKKLPIDTTDFSDFLAERYLRLPKMSLEKLAQRYKSWAMELVAEHPDTCGTVLYKGKPLGYIFGRVEGTKGYFTLGVTSQKSQVSGIGLYQQAFHMFHSQGAQSVYSSFSAANIGALNIHSSLGCRFVSATTIYIWINPEQPD
jgi:hypothetical protein